MVSERAYLAQKSDRLNAAKRKRAATREALVKALGGKCSCCGEEQVEFLLAPKNDEVVCGNCQLSRQRFSGTCPHEKDFYFLRNMR